MKELVHRVLHPNDAHAAVYAEAQRQEARRRKEGEEREQLRTKHQEAIHDAEQAFRRVIELTEDDIGKDGQK